MAFKSNTKLALCTTLILFFVAQIVIISNNTALFWDESVYIGMGKFIFSGGSSGLWEPIRPLFIPLIAGAFWTAGLNPVIYGRLLASALSVGSILLTFLIAKKIFGKTEAIISAALLATAPLFFGFASFFLTDISSTFFALLALYFFISHPKSQKHLFFSGMLLGIAFLTRFPQIIVLLSLLLFLIFENRVNKTNSKETLKRALSIILGFVVVSSPYFVFNHSSYGTSIGPLINAQITVTQESARSYGGDYAYYFKHPAEQNFLPILWIIGISLFLIKKSFDPPKYPVILASLLFISYITFVPHKELRYILIAMPLMAIIAAYPLATLLKRVRIDFKPIAAILAAYLIIIAYVHVGYVNSFFEQTNKISAERDMADRILSFENNAPVYASTPLIAAYIDNPIIVNYYTPESFAEQSVASGKNEYIAIATCAFPCSQGDYVCEKRNRDMLDRVASKSALLWNKNTTKCEYYLFNFTARNS